MEAIFTAVAFLILAPLAAFIARTIYLLYHIFTTDCRLITSECSLRTILCIGSGGHTTEMLRIATNLDRKKYQPRLYIVAQNDVSSEVKIHKSELCQLGDTKYSLSMIPRSRNVQQSYLTAVFSTLYATLLTIPIIYKFKPSIILCNGPGTCVPICIVAFILRCLFLLDCRIVFVESICRVRTMSLTGKILQFFADIVVVQWPQLRDVCFRAKYFGRLT